MKSNVVSILLLVRSLELGGAERQLVALARGLHDRGHRVAVAAFYTIGPLQSELRQAGIPIIDLRKKGRWETLKFLNRLRRIVRNFQPDVIYSFLGGANIVAAAVRPFVPEFKLVWSIRASDMDLSHYDWLHRVSYRVERLMSDAPDLIIANSCAGRDFAITHGMPRGRIEVVHNGIDIERFRPDRALRRTQRARWGIADDLIAVGVLARLDPMKGHPDFLRAAVRVLKMRQDVRFFCIGAGFEESRLRRLVAELGIAGAVEFTGSTTDPVAALNGLDICCSASVFGEGFSNAIAEAMACGLPCVATDVGDSARIVGDAGIIVPRSNDEALASAILSLVDGDRRRLGAKGRQRVIEHFSVDIMVERTLVLLNEAHLSVRGSRA